MAPIAQSCESTFKDDESIEDIGMRTKHVWLLVHVTVNMKNDTQNCCMKTNKNNNKANLNYQCKYRRI